MSSKIGLIGVGNIGVHFANRLLLADHALVIYDANPDAVRRLVDKGAIAAKSAREVADTAEIILLSLPLPKIVAGVSADLADGDAVRVVVDLSTTGPDVTKDIAPQLKAKGIAFVGAPVSGGTVAAEKGTLAIMASGPKAAFDEIEPILASLGKSIFYLGEDPSLGQTMKTINNTLYATAMVASFEALVYGVKAGLDARAMLDVLNTSSGRSFATMERIPQCVLDRSFPLRFTTELLHKDVKLCLDDAEILGTRMLIAPETLKFLAYAIEMGDGPKDIACPIHYFEEWAGVQFGEST